MTIVAVTVLVNDQRILQSFDINKCVSGYHERCGVEIIHRKFRQNKSSIDYKND